MTSFYNYHRHFSPYMAQDGLYASRVMENQEAILDALTDFERKTNKEIPPILDQYLLQVARTGETLFPWTRLKPLFVKKLDSVMQQFNEEYPADHLPLSPNVENVKFEEMRSRIICAVSRFHGAPFTIQRLCELITDPTRHYKRSDKFLRGIEKLPSSLDSHCIGHEKPIFGDETIALKINIMVVSTVDPFGRKVVCESRNIVNGIDVNGHTASIRTPPHTPPPPPVPSPPLWPATAMDSATIWPASKSDSDKPDSPVYDENCDGPLGGRTVSSPPLSGSVPSTDTANSNGNSASEDRCDKEDSSSSFDSNADDRDAVQSSASSSSEESTLSSGDDSSQQSPTSQNSSEESIEQSAADSCTNQQTEREQKQPTDTAEMMQSDEDEKSEKETKKEEKSTQPVSSKENGSDSNGKLSGAGVVEEDMPSLAENSAESTEDADSKCDLADTTSATTTTTTTPTTTTTSGSSSSSKSESDLTSTNSSTVVSTSEESQEMSEESGSASSTSSSSSSTSSEPTDSIASTESPMVTCTSSSATTTTITTTTKTTEATAKSSSDVGQLKADKKVPCTDNSVSSTDEMSATSVESSTKDAPLAKVSRLSKNSDEEDGVGGSNEASSVMETDSSESEVATKQDPKSSDSKSEPSDPAATTTATSRSDPQVPESNTPDEEPMEL